MHRTGNFQGVVLGSCLAYSPITFAVELTPLSSKDCRALYQSCSCSENECIPDFESKIVDLSSTRIEKLKQGGWEEGCPIALSEIQSVTVLHIKEDGSVQQGELIVARSVAKDVEKVFRALFESRFVIHKMVSIENYGGNDDLSMKDNNTSALNCRNVKGTNRWSQHSYGTAIDINPLWNPYVRSRTVEPPEGAEFLDRNAKVPGLIRAGDPIITLFREIGWKWGGYWRNSKDYQHFSLSGR